MQLLCLILAIVGPGFIYFIREFSQFKGEVRTFMKTTINSFNKFGEFEKEVRANFKGIDKKFHNTEKRFDRLELKIDKST